METEPGQPVQQEELVPQADYSAYEKDFVFPVTKYTKKEIKALKVCHLTPQTLSLQYIDLRLIRNGKNVCKEMNLYVVLWKNQIIVIG